jgi:hypothetical protein
MKPECSLTHSQQPVSCPYPKPDRSTPRPLLPTSHFSKVHFNIILLSTPESYKRFPFVRFPHLNPVCTSPLSHTCYMLFPSHSLFDHPNNIRWGVHIMKFLVMQSSPLPCYLVPLGPKYPPQHPILENPQPAFLLPSSVSKQLNRNKRIMLHGQTIKPLQYSKYN